MADAPVRRRRWPRRVAVALIVFAVLLFIAPMIVARTGLIQSNLNKALADFDGSVTVGSTSLGWFAPVTLRDVVVKDAQGRTLATVPAISTSKTLFGYLKDHDDLGTIALERPTLEIVCENGTTNLEASLKKILEKPGDPNAPKPKIAISADAMTLTIKDADAKKEWTHTIAKCAVAIGDATKLHVRIDEPHRLECDVTFGPQIAGTFDANRFPLESLTPFLKRFEPGLELDARLSGQVVTTFIGNTIDIQGDIRLENVNAASPRLGGERIVLDRIELPFQLLNTGTTIEIKSSRLACKLGTATFVGSIDTAQPVEKLLQQPGLQASVNVNLAALAKMLPALLKLRPGTELSQGTLEAYLASKPGTSGVTWSGHCKATALKGRRDGTAIVWEEPIIATFAGRLDNKLRPEFESLNVVSDFARVDAKGKLESFTAEGFVSLDKLSDHLAKFIDLSGTRLQGEATLKAMAPPGADGLVVNGSLKFEKLAAESRDFRFAAEGLLKWNLRKNGELYRFEEIAGSLQNVRFRGLGIDLDEPSMEVLPTSVDWDAAKNRLTVPEVTFATQTLAVAVRNLNFDGGAIAFSASFNANLARIQKTLALAGEPVSGFVHGGELIVTTENGARRVIAKLPLQKVAYGPAAKPVWSEPVVTVRITGLHNPREDSLTIDSAILDRPDGTSLSANGIIRPLTAKPALDLRGELNYDLATFEPQFKDLLGKSVKAAGKDKRPFHLKGNLDDLTLLVGDASLGWQSVSAYGFDVGKSQLEAKLQGGTLTTNPIEATFASTGKVKLQPTVRLQPNTFDLVFAKGRVIERATLTPAACAEAIGFALPAIAKSSQAEGTLSFDLDEHRILFKDINRSTMHGKLTLHNVSVVSGPVISQVAEVFGQQQPRLDLAREQVVVVRVENGRVYHENLTLTMAGFSITTSGSVGFDGALNLNVTLPVPEALASTLRNLPAVREAIAKKRFTVTIGGTLSHPKFDKAGFNGAVAQFLREVTRDAAANKLGDLLKKGLEKADPKKP